MSDAKQSMQAAFDKATSALLTQGDKCSSGFDSGSCFYRHPDKPNFRCAIGHLMSDFQMGRYFIQEGNTPADFQSELVAEILPEVDTFEGRQFLEALQAAHDNVSRDGFCVNFTRTANEVAFQYGLTPIKP